MARRRFLSLSIIFLAFVLILSAPCAYSQQFGAYGPEGNIEDWIVVESSYATIFVDKDIGLKDVVKRIDVSFAIYDPIESRLFLNKGISDEERLANKIDIIVRKARKILDMHPQGFNVNIRVYESNQDMWDTYQEIFKERKEYIAFYIHKFQTVYISLDNVSESVLAHEIGHSIIDNYFGVLPPMKIRELLACYVDVHLKD